MTSDLALSRSIVNAADLIDCVAQREAYRRATELIGPSLGRIGGNMAVGMMDGFTALPQPSLEG
ncbi:hypothetical protein HUE56_15320 [Azospirillum oryzae]|uniref:Uncharacterized protein n=1 Tax=Azospirillum oryzae TaxID=286727 RepID=A0A6N1AL07_9PROT|nr:MULTISPECIES: hypothetical protein [Azospirillum]KAA0582714.1 hypothetical protein FZ029_01060 [Azospirillum sp. Sh1]KAA0589977.1 hypothetical protein FZ938_10315 [Azospirillum oryzae]QKS51818.1 hypothetical protein HUE56_15320 [Azospirillum oryzae]GLR82752.1 hypothetical protein GCM10007856_54530 [Azospirillum oryzae]